MSAPAAVIIVLLLMMICIAAFHGEWHLIVEERRFNAAYRSRPPLSDEAMVELYFKDSSVDPTVAITVRRITAEQLQYDALRLHPDDDFMFILAEVDCVELIMEVEEAFSIEISDSDSSMTSPTIRAMAELVQRKLNEKAARVGRIPG